MSTKSNQEVTNFVFSCQICLVNQARKKMGCLQVKELHLERREDCLVEEETCLMMLKETRYLSCDGNFFYSGSS